MDNQQKLRIDKWLWAVRIYKTRTLATSACQSGKVKIGGNRVKPSRQISIGDKITVQKDLIKREFIVTGLLEKRGSAKIAIENVEDITPEIEKVKQKLAFSGPAISRDRGKGRPTKRERRKMDIEKW